MRAVITKPDVGGGVSHPARFSDTILGTFTWLLGLHLPLTADPLVLDPFAGTGRIHELRGGGFRTAGIELEEEWAALHPATAQGDARRLPFRDETFDAIVTSPCYGNRLADSYESSDPHLRRSYRFDLGRELRADNAGAMQWGDSYRMLHEYAWWEATRVAKPGAVFLLNLKDHIRTGARQHVSGWHVTTLCRFGWLLLEHHDVASRHLRQGANGDLRLVEQIYVLRKETA